MSFEALNPTLYRRLCQRYGEDNVNVTARGEAIEWRVVERVNPAGEKYLSREVEHPGEQYNLRCRKCRDHRARLFVNHRWGVFDLVTKTRNLWMAHCFNEDCYGDYESQLLYFDYVYSDVASSRFDIHVNEGRRTLPAERSCTGPPGPLWSLEELLRTDPDHRAIEFVRNRGFRPLLLSKKWGVGYCLDSKLKHARDRLYIPFRDGSGQTIGWQARYLGDSVGGVAFNKAGIPKYYTAPGFRKSLHPYNMEAALAHDTVVVVEGVTDVWRFGPMALAAAGKTLSQAARSRIVEWAQEDRRRLLIVAFDHNPGKPAKGKSPGVHPSDALLAQLVLPMQGRVVKLSLPVDTDPADLPRDYLRELAKKAAADKGLSARFTRPRSPVAGAVV